MDLSPKNYRREETGFETLQPVNTLCPKQTVIPPPILMIHPITAVHSYIQNERHLSLLISTTFIKKV